MGSIINPFISFPVLGGGGDDDPHEYWRILITANNGDGSFVGVGTLEMYEDFGRVNKCSGGTPFASSGGVFGNVTSSAFDTDYTTQWAVAKTGSDSIGYQFPSPVNIKGVSLRDRGSSQNTLMPSSFKVQWSDNGSSWTDRWSVAGADFVTAGDYTGLWFWDPSYTPSYSGSPLTSTRYWRFLCLQHTADTFSCAELKMATTPAGSNIATGGTPFASSSTFGAAADAFDGNDTTFWAPSNSIHSLGYDFGSGNDKKLAEMRWKSRAVGAPGQNPRRGIIQYSLDNSFWSSLWDAYDGVTWTDGMEKTFADPLYV